MRNDPEKVLQFFRCLKLVEGEMAGKFYEPMQWHQDVVRGLFGPVDDEGYRKVREAYISVPRKNSKSTFCSALACYMLFATGEQGAQVYCVATTAEQGRICFRIIAGMIRQQPTLRGMCRILESRSEILVPSTNSRLKVLSRIAGQAHGLNPSFVIYDELHAATNGDLYAAMLTGSGARREPLLCAITTAGHSRASICYTKYAYAKRWLSGAIQDDAFFAYIKEPEEGDDWKDPKVWEKVNPGWGISVKPKSIEALARQAIAIPSEENNFRQLYLNEWVSNSKRWLSMDAWDATLSEAKLEDFSDCEFYAGLDLSSTKDLTALCLCCKQGEYFHLFPYFFLPTDAIDGNKINRAAYQGWQKSGHLIGSIGNVIDYQQIVDKVYELAEKVKIQSVAYDPWNSAWPIAQLANDFDVVKYSQSFAIMSPASKDFERALLNKTLLHDNNAVMRWCADNVEILTDRAGNIRPVAPSEENKVDGIVAGIMAFDLCAKNTMTSDSSIYEERGVITI